MQNKLIPIGKAAAYLGVSIDTLRRWDKKGQLPAVRTSTGGNRYYHRKDLDMLLKNPDSLAKQWVTAIAHYTPESDMYCQTSDVFKARLEQLKTKLSRIVSEDTVSLIITIAGEIGNNSFDHNLGNWPDIMGTFFAYSMNRKQVVLADRGQGMLITLKRVKPSINTHQEALTVAFTERISGRSAEARGNGLKLVKEVVKQNPFTLYFQTGDAYLELKEGTSNVMSQKADMPIQGCFAVVGFKGAS